MEQNVSVQQEETSMVQFVWSVSMDSNGTTKKELVNVPQDINGQESPARKLTNVVVTEFGILSSSIVSVLKENTGMEDNVGFNLNVQEVKDGMLKLFHVFVQEDPNGIQKNARFAETDKFGMSLL